MLIHKCRIKMLKNTYYNFCFIKKLCMYNFTTDPRKLLCRMVLKGESGGAGIRSLVTGSVPGSEQARLL